MGMTQEIFITASYPNVMTAHIRFHSRHRDSKGNPRLWSMPGRSTGQDFEVLCNWNAVLKI
jgi:hypothetical protein